MATDKCLGRLEPHEYAIKSVKGNKSTSWNMTQSNVKYSFLKSILFNLVLLSFSISKKPALLKCLYWIFDHLIVLRQIFDILIVDFVKMDAYDLESISIDLVYSYMVLW